MRELNPERDLQYAARYDPDHLPHYPHDDGAVRPYHTRPDRPGTRRCDNSHA